MRLRVASGCLLSLLAACNSSSPASLDGITPILEPSNIEICEPGISIVFSYVGTISAGQEKTYIQLPIEVPAGAQRFEVGYSWQDNPGPPSTPITQTVVDLGVWDADGYREAKGFRGWSGSRQGRINDGQPPVFITTTQADRGYTPGPLEAGTWFIELGYAAVAPQGATINVTGTIACDADAAAPLATAADPVDAKHISRREPGWYHGDFHMHGFHSSPAALDPQSIVLQARDAGLDFLMITEYVTGQHWQEWGATQRQNPDLLIWPGREIITYFGHANSHGETPDVLEYRHGFEDVRLGEIQRITKQSGALFQVNHPTTFPGPLFENFCRGCEFTLGDELDWNLVDLVEIVNGPILVQGSDVGAPLPTGEIQNPFTQPAIDYWEDLLQKGYRITPVSGSDSKGTQSSPEELERSGYGSSATVVFAQELSRAGITAALKAGRVYLQTHGALHSPELEFFALGPDGTEVMFGGEIKADSATLRTHVRNGANQFLRYLVNGQEAFLVPITSDDFVHEQMAFRGLNDGPLGTYWRIETVDLQSLTAIGSPIYLTGPEL